MEDIPDSLIAAAKKTAAELRTGTFENRDAALARLAEETGEHLYSCSDAPCGGF